MRLPEIELDDRRFQDLVTEARTAHRPRLPGVDRAQRLRPRHHADRAVRVDDRDDDLPAQPRAGQAARRAARPARDPARRPDRRAAPSLRFRLAAPPTEPVVIPGGDDRGRHAAHAPTRSRSSSRSTRTSRSRRRARRRTWSSAAARSRTSASPTATARPQGADQLAVRRAAAGRRRALPRLRGAARAAADRRSTSTPRRRAAPASTPRTRRCAGRSPQGDGELGGRRGARGPHRRLQLRLRHGRARSCPPRTRRRAARRPPRCTGCAAGSTDTTRSGARRRDLHAPARDLLDHRGADRRAAPGDARRRAIEREVLGVERRHAGPGRSRCATRRCSSSARGETLEVQDPESGDWERWELREDFVELDRVDRHFVLDLVVRRGRARPGDPRDRRRLDAVRRGARRRARSLRFTPLPPRRRPRRATSRPGR